MRVQLLAVPLLLLAAAARADEVSLPPGERPVPVRAGVFLVSLNGVAERDETFDADLYLSFRWHDPRLAFQGSEPHRFLEDAAVTRLGEIWWPQLEFVNTAEASITNRLLEIEPDGGVYYRIGMTSDFRASLDLRRFPFDRQTLAVRVQSFTWTSDQMVFVPDATRVGFSPESPFEGLRVTGVDAVVERSHVAGWELDFSEFVARIDVRRQSAFFVWTVFVPVTLIFLISCAMFVVPLDEFAERLGIALTALLACVATQFAISFNLPQISYLTVVDRIFVVTYVCIAAGVLASTLAASLLRNDAARAARVDRWMGFGLPVLFVALCALCIVW